MPKGFRGRAPRGNTATLDTTDQPETGYDHNTLISTPQETNTVTSITTAEPDVAVDEDGDDVTTKFEFSMEAAPEDYTPERKTPGRQRRESFFDDKLRSATVFGMGWQKVPVTSADHKAAVIRELNRAKLYLNGTGRLDGEPEIGLDLDDKQDDAIYFKARVAQKRERKGNGSDALTENANGEGLTDPDGDNDE